VVGNVCSLLFFALKYEAAFDVRYLVNDTQVEKDIFGSLVLTM